MPSTEQTDKIAFDYAWNWFALHAGQRMQSVNFFLVAASFFGPDLHYESSESLEGISDSTIAGLQPE